MRGRFRCRVRVRIENTVGMSLWNGMSQNVGTQRVCLCVFKVTSDYVHFSPQ